MRLIPETDPLPRLLAWPYLTIALGGWALLRLRGDALLRVARCPLREVMGVPCPTCGGSHAATALARGDLAAAASANPLIAAGALALAVWALLALAATAVPRWRRQVALDARERRALRWLVVWLIAASWAYQLTRA